jgi:division/cell wall cluster transcriptional repressor MraZ
MAHALVGVVLAVVASAVARLVGDELKAWNPKLRDLIVRFAVSRLPRQERERYSEEWRAHINDAPGEIGKLCVATGCVWASLIRAEFVERPKVDRKGRFKVPARFKNELEGNYGSLFFVTSLIGDVALVYPLGEWERIEQKLASISVFNPTKKKFLDRVNYYGQVVEMDAQGRLLIPLLLRKSAGLKGEVEVTPRPQREDAGTNEEMAEHVRICYLEVRSIHT